MARFFSLRFSRPFATGGLLLALGTGQTALAQNTGDGDYEKRTKPALKNEEGFPRLPSTVTPIQLRGQNGFALATCHDNSSSTNHEVVLENEQLRIIRIELNPGEKGAVYRHPGGLIILLVDVPWDIAVPLRPPIEALLTAGQSWQVQSGEYVLENTGRAPVEMLSLELKARPSSPRHSEYNSLTCPEKSPLLILRTLHNPH